MAKKLSKSRKKSVKRIKKKSWLQSLLTFPVLFIITVIGMGIFTVYYVSRPSSDVMGITTANYVMYTEDELKSLMAANPTAYKFDHYLKTRIFADKNGNGEMDGDESCLSKKYTFMVNGVQKTKQKDDCKFSYVKIPECKVSSNSPKTKVTFLKTLTSNKYIFTGMEYFDRSHKFGKVTKKNTAYLCGDSGYFNDGGGYSQVDFGVQASN